MGRISSLYIKSFVDFSSNALSNMNSFLSIYFERSKFFLSSVITTLFLPTIDILSTSFKEISF